MAALLVLLASCGVPEKPKNLVPREETEKREVNFFSPMEKTDPNAENVARTASDLTIAMAEERLGFRWPIGPIQRRTIRIRPMMRCLWTGSAAIWTIYTCSTRTPF